MKQPTIKRRGKMYCTQVMVDGVRHYIQDESEKVCMAKAMELKAGLTKRDKNSKTLTEAIDDYILSKQNILSPSSIRGYRTIQRTHFKGILNAPLSQIDKHTLQREINAECRIYSAKTVKNATGLVLSVIAEYTGNRLSVSLPQVIVNEHPFLSPEQVPTFLSLIEGTEIEVPCLLGLWSLRRSEMLGLRWQDIDLKKRTININGAFVPNEHNEFVRKAETKNRSSRRTVPMCDRLYELLSARCGTGEELVVNINGETLRRKVNNLCEENGLPLIGVHGLRHSFISVGYSAGIPPHILQEIGGWSTDATIKQRYLHISQQDKSRYTDALLNMFCNRNCNSES